MINYSKTKIIIKFKEKQFFRKLKTACDKPSLTPTTGETEETDDCMDSGIQSRMLSNVLVSRSKSEKE